MTRIVLFAALFAFCTVSLALPVSSAWAAEEGKGVFSFFNRSKNSDGNAKKPTDPVFMKPMQNSGSTGERVKPINLGRGKSSSKVARYEDSPIFKQSLENNKIMKEWNSNEVATAQAKTAVLMQRIKAEQAQAQATAQQEQMQLIAQNKNRTPPPGMGLQSGRTNSLLPQSVAASPVTPATDEPVVEPTTDEAPTVRKPRHFFNRSE